MISENKLDHLIASLKGWVEASLEEALAGINRIEQVENRVDLLTNEDYKIETTVRNLTESISSDISRFTESVSSIQGDLQEKEQSIVNLFESLEELRKIASDIDNLSVKCEDFNNHKEEYLESIEKIISSVDAVNSSLIESESKFSESIAKESLDRESLKKTVDENFDSIESSFGVLNESIDTISKHISSVNKSISGYKRDSDRSTSALKESIESVGDELVILAERNTFLKEYVESQYVELKKQTGSVLALKTDSSVFESVVENINEQIENTITEFKQELLSSNLDTSQVSRDVSRLFSFADSTKAKISSIETDIEELKSREPIKGLDGKNGLNWEFKTHPMAKGTLFFKREDQVEWQSINLMPKIIMDTIYGNSGSGVGVREARKIAAAEVDDARVTVTRNGQIIEEKLSVLEVEGGGVTVTNPSPGVVRLTVLNGGGGGSAETTFIGNTSTPILTYRAIGTVLTNALGEFSFDFGLTGITTVYDVDVKSYLLQDVGLDPQERIVDCYVSTITSNVVSGVAYFNQRVGGTIGDSTYCKVPAEAGIEVIVTVEGAL